ncbi:MAG: 16S rRNA (adenine(1518)-N(6)/adenine(1519)-N(6))-dimethyltransferase RsmA [Planctomycetota bacterium]
MSGADRDSFAEYRDRLEAMGFRPKRRFGQNFLLDPSLHAVIASAANIGGEDRAIEIGGGLGFLTRELAVRAAEVLVAEIDPLLARVLREDFADRRNVQVVEGDALGSDDRLGPSLEVALEEAERRCSRRTVVAANLPYATSGPLLAALAVRRASPPIAGMGLLVQLEFARRLVAAPRSEDYGGLTVLAQAYFEVRLLRTVGREVFRPRPNVDSAIVELRSRPIGGSAAAAHRPEFARFVRQLFTGRRKVLRHALDTVEPGWRELVEQPDRVGSCRAEELGHEEVQDLFARLAPRRGSMAGPSLDGSGSTT